MDLVSYSMFRLWKPFIFLVFGVMAVVGVVILVTPPAGKSHPPLYFDALWFPLLLWNAYWFLYRLSYRIELNGGQLRWFTPLRRGAIAIEDLVSIGPAPAAYQLALFKQTAGPSVMAFIQPGLSDFAAEVQKRAPQVDVQTGLYEKLSRFARGRNGFQRGK